MNYPWSDMLVEQTRNALRSLPVIPDGYLKRI
jgi:hypothetical protein